MSDYGVRVIDKEGNRSNLSLGRTLQLYYRARVSQLVAGSVDLPELAGRETLAVCFPFAVGSEEDPTDTGSVTATREATRSGTTFSWPQMSSSDISMCLCVFIIG